MKKPGPKTGLQSTYPVAHDGFKFPLRGRTLQSLAPGNA